MTTPTTATPAPSPSLPERSFQDAIDEAGDTLTALRAASHLPGPGFPGLQLEFTNWRSEQHAWHEGAALFNQSHHMTDLFVSGPDALALFSSLGINSFANFEPGRAKQFVAVNSEGYVIGDAILFHLEQDRFDLVGHPYVAEWVQFHAETGDFDVTTEWDRNSARRAGHPKEYRFEIQGPAADAVIEAATGEPLPPVKFFHMTEFTIAGHRVRALRHGMAGQLGFEIWGPWDEGDEVRAALLAAGEPLGLRPAGWRAYLTANIESAWIPAPLPAIYSGEGTEEYRRWRDGNDLDSLGGSMDSAELADYYVTPWDLDYGRLIRFDHDFVGREALERRASDPHRRKVTLVWNDDDFAAVMGSLVDGEELPGLYLELPKPRHARFVVDKVTSGERTIGLALDHSYIAPEQKFLSLATIDEEFAEPGTEVTLVWGENPAVRRPQTEAHRPISVRVTVAPAPYASFARESYRG